MALVISLSMIGSAQATVVDWVGPNGTWYSNASVWAPGGNALSTFGRDNGWDFSSSGVAANPDVIIGVGDAVYYNGDTAGEFRFSSDGNANGGTLTIENGGVFNMESDVYAEGNWTQWDAERLTVTGAGSLFNRYNTPNIGASTGLNGGALIFGSWRGYADPSGQNINIDVMDYGELRNKGQTWFGTYGDEELLNVTLTIGEGAKFSTNGALENGISLDDTAGGYEGEFNFIYSNPGGGYNQHDYKWIFEDNGGSMNVGVEGIRFQVFDDGKWKTAQVTYENMWDGITNANVTFYSSGGVLDPLVTPLANPYILRARKPGGAIASAANGDLFSGYFTTVGGFISSPLIGGDASASEANYKLTSIAGATVNGSHPGDINGDLFIDSADFGILVGNFGTGTSVAEGDINLDAPGDDLVDAADVGVMFGNWTGDHSPAGAGSASGFYNSGTGEIEVSVNGVVNWYVEYVGGSAMTGDSPVGLNPAYGLITDNDVRIGQSGFAPFVYDLNLGNVAVTGIPRDCNMMIFWNASLGGELQSACINYIVPEPSTIFLIGMGIISLSGGCRRRTV